MVDISTKCYGGPGLMALLRHRDSENAKSFHDHDNAAHDDAETSPAPAIADEIQPAVN